MNFLENRSAGSPLTEVIPLTKSQNPDFGFPEGRLHQTERAGIAEMLNMFQKNDFPKLQKLKFQVDQNRPFQKLKIMFFSVDVRMRILAIFLNR